MIKKNQLWINTDPFLDIQQLKSIELDIVRGICLSKHDPSLLYHPQGRYDFVLNGGLDTIISQDDPMRPLYEDIKATNSRTAMTFFAKLCYEAQGRGTSILLRRPSSFKVKNFAADCADTENIEHFESLMKFIKTMPFVEIGRIVLFVNDHEQRTHIHRDTNTRPHENEFIWFRPNLVKSFFILSQSRNIKSIVTSYSAFFNEMDLHGTEPSPTMTYSIRVDGMFTDEFRNQLEID